jgi:hypothetical protein
MLFEMHGHGINLSESYWQDAVHAAFAPIELKFSRTVIRMSVSVATLPSGNGSPMARCRVGADLFGSPSVHVEADDAQTEHAIQHAAAQMLEALNAALGDA